MKKYWVLILCLLPFLVQAKCTLGSNTSAQQTIELDMTTVTVGSPVRLVINTNLNDTFSCNENTDFMDYTTPFQNYVIELKEPGTNKSIFLKFNMLENTEFPVATGNGGGVIASKSYTTQEAFNSKPFILEVSYITPGSADLTISSGNTINLGRPAINILADNSCRKSLGAWLWCWLTGKLSGKNTYAQNITFTVKHKPTTCRFSQSTYEIKMPNTTLKEMLSANNTKSGPTELELKCESINNVTTNPVSFKVVRGDWDSSGTILKNTVMNGAKGVGFQIFNGSATSPLKLGDTLMNKIAKLTEIKSSYTFPITAKYVRVTGESLQPGDVQSKVTFAVSYD